MHEILFKNWKLLLGNTQQTSPEDSKISSIISCFFFFFAIRFSLILIPIFKSHLTFFCSSSLSLQLNAKPKPKSLSTSLGFIFEDKPINSSSVLRTENHFLFLFFWLYFNLVIFFYEQSDWNFMALFQLLPCPFRDSVQTPSPPSSPTSSYYDVFLSFSGKDTRKNFTDHLYTALKQKGIIIFRDDERLERGKYISQELLKAIEETKFAIIILSTNYAS